MNHDRYDYSPIIKREPIKWPNNARVAVWVIPNIEYYEFDIPSVGHQPVQSCSRYHRLRLAGLRAEGWVFGG